MANMKRFKTVLSFPAVTRNTKASLEATFGSRMQLEFFWNRIEWIASESRLEVCWKPHHLPAANACPAFEVRLNCI